LGFEYLPQGDASLMVDLTGLPLFSQGRSKKITGLMRGRARDREVALFDYTYITGSGKHRHTWRQTVAGFRFDGPPLPKFVLRPEHLFHKLGSLFGYQDIDFDSHPAFSKRYLLRGDDEPAVRHAFTSEVLEFFEANPGLTVEGADGRLVVYRPGHRAKPEAVRDLLDEGLSVLSLLRGGD
jgi:hypothetical protein